MSAYWASLAEGSLVRASQIVTDMLPVIGVIAGIALAGRVIGMLRRAF